MVKNLPANAVDVKDVGSVPGSGRTLGRGQATPVFLPGEFQGQMSLVDYSTWDCKESDTTGATWHAGIYNIQLYILSQVLFPYRLLQNTRYNSLCHTV